MIFGRNLKNSAIAHAEREAYGISPERQDWTWTINLLEYPDGLNYKTY